MYNIEQVRILIKYKQQQLQELKNDSSSSSIEIKKVEDELKTLEIYSVRYEIATIIGFENSAEYRRINYTGIETEDFTTMNLSQEQLDKLSSLTSQIPPYNAELFKTRLEMAKLLKLDEDQNLQAINYDGIENTNPSSMQYRLGVNEVAKFNSLRNRVTILRQSNNFKNSNISDMAKAVRDSLIAKLDSMDIEDYKKNKDEDLETLFKLMDLMGEDKSFPVINNYEFAYDIYKKYPRVDVKLSSTQIIELLELLDKDKTIEQSKYNDYIEIITKNVIALLRDEKDSDETINVLDKINKSGYSLRIDLESRIIHEKVQFNSKEIEDIVRYLDKNYDKLDDKEKDKLFRFAVARIKSELHDPKNADRINDLIKEIKNKELREKLRNALKEREEAIFDDQHETTYSSLIKEKIKKLEIKKSRYLRKRTGIGPIDMMYQTRAREIDKEIARLRELNLSYDDNVIVNGLDEMYNSRSAKIIKIRKQIQELEELKKGLKTEYQKRSIDRKIIRLKYRIKGIQNAQTKIEGFQKRVMTPKMFVEMKRGMINRRFESKAEVYGEQADDLEAIAAKEREMGGMFNRIKAAFHEFKAGRYRSKSEFNRTLFGILSRPGNKITITGSTQIKTSRQQVQALQQQMQDQNANQLQIAA